MSHTAQPPSQPRRPPTASRQNGLALAVLALLVLVAAAGLLAGLRQDLPLGVHVDEPMFVTMSMRMAATGDFNPHWFGHPGSTLIYPLAAVFTLYTSIFHGGGLPPEPAVNTMFLGAPAPFYLLGRLVSILYLVAALPLVYAVGAHAFNRRVGLVGTWIAMLSPVTIFHVQHVRTDGAGVFFAMLALWAVTRAYRHPSRRWAAVVGCAVGLAVATRYLLVAVAPVAALGIVLPWREGRRQHGDALVDLAVAGTAGLLAMVISTPYLFVDGGAMLASVAFEARSTQLGADGLGFAQRVAWYLTEAGPGALTWPVALAALFGSGLVLLRGTTLQRLLPIYVGVFVVVISLPSLHWSRWLIQILPVVALLAAFAVIWLTDLTLEALGRFSRPSPTTWGAAAAVLVTVLVTLPAAEASANLVAAQSRPTTKVEATRWIQDNLPEGSRVALDLFSGYLVPDDLRGSTAGRYTEPLERNGLVVYQPKNLATHPDLDYYREHGFEYLVTSSNAWGSYYSDPERYAEEIDFYERLWTEAELLMKVAPNGHYGGPEIKVYRLDDVQSVRD